MKPDKHFSEKIKAVMERDKIMPLHIAKDAKVSLATLNAYIEFKEVRSWRDSAVAAVASVLNRYDLEYAAKRERERKPLHWQRNPNRMGSRHANSRSIDGPK